MNDPTLQLTENPSLEFFDILKMLTCVSIASKSYLHQIIDTIYEENSYKYLTYYKKHKIYSSTYFKTHTYEIEKYSLKVAGIIEYAIDTKDHEKFLLLFKKGFKKQYNLLKKSQELNINTDILNICMSEGTEGNKQFFATLFTCFLLEKKIVGMDMFGYIVKKVISDELLVTHYKDINYRKEILEGFATTINNYRKKLGLANKSYTLEELGSVIMEKDINENYSIFDGQKHTELTIQKVGSRSKYIGAIEGVFKYFQIHMGDFYSSTIFTTLEIDELLMSYILAKEFNSFDSKQDFYSYMVYTIYLSAIIKEYKSLKEAYVQNVNEAYIIERNNYEISISKLNMELQRVRTEQTTKEMVWDEKYTKLVQENQTLEKEIERLKNRLQEEDDLKKEVVSLRNYVFDTSETLPEDVMTPNIDINWELLNSKRVAILGGHVNWQKKMKEVLPNYRYVNSENKNSDLSFLHNMDIVFINTKMKHGFYYRILKELANSEVRFTYLSSEVGSRPIDNIELSLQQIQKELQK